MNFLQRLFGKTNKQPEEQPQPAAAVDFIDLTKVFPRVKGVFTDETPDPLPANDSPHITASFNDSPVYETFAKGLGVFYALDKGTHYQLLQNKHLSDTITRETLHQAALANMATAISDRTQVDGDVNNIMMLTNGGNFEAAMLLADEFWENMEQVLNDQICVAVPARDLLFIAAKTNPTGRESLRQAIRRFFDEQETQGLLVRHIYERQNNGWSLIETA